MCHLKRTDVLKCNAGPQKIISFFLLHYLVLWRKSDPISNDMTILEECSGIFCINLCRSFCSLVISLDIDIQSVVTGVHLSRTPHQVILGNTLLELATKVIRRFTEILQSLITETVYLPWVNTHLA